MTREEAIEILKFQRSYFCDLKGCEELQAYTMAIKALEQEPCEDIISQKIEEFELKGKIAEIWIVKGNLQIRYSGIIHNISLPPVTPKQRWIPVSERLPEEDGEYLLWGKVIEYEENNYIFIGDYDSCAEAFGYWKEYYDPSTLGYVDGELNRYASVIAWMPLPEPYKAEREVKNEDDRRN